MKLEVGFLASPARRLAAYILDIAIPAFVTIVMVAGAAGAAAASEGQEPTNESLAAGLIPLAALAAYLITAIIMFFRGTTPGKWMVGLRVVRQSGKRAGFMTMFFREFIGKMLSGLVFCLGYFWILIDKDNQGWHDKLVTTYVVQ